MIPSVPEHEKPYAHCISPTAAALMLLCWQEPTDRALAGWCPDSTWEVVSGYDEANKERWLREKVRMHSMELRDIEHVRESGIGNYGAEQVG